MEWMRKRYGVVGLVVLLLTAIVVFGMPALSAGPLYTPRERFGFAFVTMLDTPQGWQQHSLSDYSVGPLNAGWYSDWTFRATPDMPADTTIEYAQLLRVGDANWPPDWSEVQNAVSFNPGALWMIGNEPDCPNQDAVTPAQYAERYHDAFWRIKGWDPTAQIAIGAIVEPTPLRFRWLEDALAAYQASYSERMPVDVWNIHIQILSEGAAVENGYDTYAGAGVPVGLDHAALGIAPRQYSLQDSADVTVMQNMVLDFREWMLAQGERNKPLIISEMGVLQPSEFLAEGGSEAERIARGDQLIEDFIVASFDWLLNEKDASIGYPGDENRVVQRWLWFSLNDAFFWAQDGSPHGFNGGLYNSQTKRPTRFGVRAMAVWHGNRVNVPFVSR